jgi:hypothetical protein
MSKLIAQLPLGQAVKVDGTRSLQDLYPTLGSLVNLIVPNLFILAGVIFLFLLILGGFSIIASGSSKGVEEGQKKITTAIIGFLIMFSAYWVIQIVELLTGLTIL